VSFLKDNRKRGTVGEFLQTIVVSDSKLSIVSAYFTIHAYHALRKELHSIHSLRFLFGEPAFIKALDINTPFRSYSIVDDALAIPAEDVLKQKNIARDCAEWIREKVDVRSIVKPNFLHGKLYHALHANGVERAIAGSSNFTSYGLGFGEKRNIELNLIVDSDRDRADLKSWFDDVWEDNTGLVEDVKDRVLAYLEQLYAENEPEFIYFNGIMHLTKQVKIRKVCER